MKASKIKLDYTVNLGNYSNIKLGGEWDVQEGDDITQCFLDARKQLEDVYAEIKKRREEAVEQKAKEVAQAMK